MDTANPSCVRIQKFTICCKILSSRLVRGTSVTSTYYCKFADCGCKWYLFIDSYGDDVEIGLSHLYDRKENQPTNVRLTIVDSLTLNSIHASKEINFTPFCDLETVLCLTKKKLFHDRFGMRKVPLYTLTVTCEITAYETTDNANEDDNVHRYYKNKIYKLLRSLLLFTIVVGSATYICVSFIMFLIGYFLVLPKDSVIIMTLLLTCCLLEEKCKIVAEEATEANYANDDDLEDIINEYLKNKIYKLLRPLLLFTFTVASVIYICLSFSMHFIGYILPLPEHFVIIMNVVLTCFFLRMKYETAAFETIEENFENDDELENIINKYSKNKIYKLLRSLLLFTFAVASVIYISLSFMMFFTESFLQIPENIVIIMTLLLTCCFLTVKFEIMAEEATEVNYANDYDLEDIINKYLKNKIYEFLRLLLLFTFAVISVIYKLILLLLIITFAVVSELLLRDLVNNIIRYL